MAYAELKTTRRLNYMGKDFHMWKIKLSFVLKDNRVNYVLTDPKPPEPTESTPEEDTKHYKKWLADDFTCRHLILGAMDDDLFQSFHDQPTAKSLMDALNSCFNSPSIARRMVLFRKYVDHRMSEDIEITQHVYSKMSMMVFELKNAGIKVPDEMQAVVLMNNLPASWDELVSGLCVNMSMDKDNENALKLDSVIEKLKVTGMVRGWRKHDSAERISNSNVTRKSKVFEGTCYNCGMPGHRQNDCPERGF